MDYGLWVVGCGLWVMGYGLWGAKAGSLRSIWQSALQKRKRCEKRGGEWRCEGNGERRGVEKGVL